MALHPRQLLVTKDGSHTIAIPGMKVTYRSHHGAIQESTHVFIRGGLLQLLNSPFDEPITILEMGFGTGLNALLTLIEAERSKRKVHFTSVEKFPLDPAEISSLNYCGQLNRPDLVPTFRSLHECEWNRDIKVTTYFTINKKQKSITDFITGPSFNLVYFDAFAPAAQPELWTQEIFETLYAELLPGGLLLTYCSKSAVRRAMQAAGFNVEKIQGPHGKREMVRAVK